jgi:HNH endonuclease
MAPSFVMTEESVTEGMTLAHADRQTTSQGSELRPYNWDISVEGERWQSRSCWAIAGARNGRGYHQIRIGGRPYSASRLAWLYMTGKWPNSEISYINGKPSDTRWANLREVTSSQNRSRPKSK